MKFPKMPQVSADKWLILKDKIAAAARARNPIGIGRRLASKLSFGQRPIPIGRVAHFA